MWHGLPMGLLVVVCTQSAWAANLAFVSASSQHKGSGKEYHPINLMDDEPDSVWCEGANGLGEGEEVHFFFKKPQKIDRILLRGTDKTGRTVLRVRLSDGSNNVAIDIGSEPLDQDLKPPLRGDTYTLYIDQVGGPNKASALPKDVACLADAVLYFRNRMWGGRITKRQLKLDKRTDQILGKWTGGALGAPESWLTFAIDGTWAWDYKPLMGGRPQKAAGEYRFRGNRLLMRKGEVGRWSDVRFKIRKIKVDPDEMGAPLGDYVVIEINRALGKDMAGEYNNAEF